MTKMLDRTSNKMFGENKAVIEEILQKYLDEQELAVTHIDCEAGSKDGDNYMSLIKRVKVYFTRPSKEGQQFLTLIVKRHVLNNKLRILFNCEPAMDNEINAYVMVLPQLRKFICRDAQLPFANLYSAGIDSQGKKLIVMEDLCQLGYEMETRSKYLEFGHCVAVLKSLAKFHAASLAMKSVRPHEFRLLVPQLIPHLYGGDMQAFQHMMNSSVMESISSLEGHSNEDGKFDHVIATLKDDGGKKIYEKIKNELILDETDEWNIILHGDLWVNNLMFLKEKNTVKSAVFVDLQVFRYGHLINDLLSFIFCTTNQELRRNHLDQLLSIYHDSLIDCLKRTPSVDSEKFHELETEFSLDNISSKFKSHALFGLGSSLIITSAVTYDTLTPIIESFLNETNQENLMTSTQPPKYHSRVRDLYEEFESKGYFVNL